MCAYICSGSIALLLTNLSYFNLFVCYKVYILKPAYICLSIYFNLVLFNWFSNLTKLKEKITVFCLSAQTSRISTRLIIFIVGIVTLIICGGASVDIYLRITKRTASGKNINNNDTLM